MRKLIKSKLLSRIPKQIHLAAVLGIPHGNFSYFLNGTRGGTMAVAFRVAYLLACPVEDVIGIARAPHFVDEQEDRYPTRVLAARASYLEGVPVNHIESVLTASLKYPAGPDESHDPGMGWWMQMMRSAELAKPGSIKDTTRARALIESGSAKASPRARVKGRSKKRRSGQ